MTLTIQTDIDLAYAKAQLSQYAFFTELDVPATVNELHWHSFDAEFYITAGDVTLTDAKGQQQVCGTGTLVKVPQGTLHQEFSAEGYQILFGASVTPDQFGDPVDRPADTLD